MAKRKYTAVERAAAIEFGSYAIYKKSRLAEFQGDFHSGVYFAQYTLPDYDVCRCLWRSSTARSRRLRRRLAPMIEDGAFFITLTFRDSVLDSTSPATRRKYVRRFLKDIASDFVANKDFGKDFGREHYHAVISSLHDRLGDLVLVHDEKGAHATLKGWPYGYSNWEAIGRSSGDSLHLVCVSRYLSKLQNHALKGTASDEVMIYSRKAKNGKR